MVLILAYIDGIFSKMGQNSSKIGLEGYNSRDFFARQVEFYRWRADPKLNAHICRVSFQLQSAVRDRQKLQMFLQGRTQLCQHFSIAQLYGLGKDQGGGQQLMSFQQYACTLSGLRERLALGEALYVLQAMLNGYEVLLAKTGRVRMELQCCFITVEGEARIWFNRDYKSNELEEMKGEDISQSIGSSEMTIIKKALELVEVLASNHTEYLHFSRQFRSFMERDILQNWNFPNSRRLVNSYAYAYKLTLPTSLKDALSRWTPPNPTPLTSQTSLQSSCMKDQMMSTSSGVIKQQMIVTDGRRQTQRPLSHSDYSHSKPSSQFPSEGTVKTHSKKFSSTDLKNLSERGKACESPKMSRSDLANKANKGVDFFTLQAQQTQRLRRQRQNAVAQTKANDGARFSPLPNAFLQSPTLSGFHSVINEKEKMTKNAQKENKKKLQKKVVTVNKYVNFYQQQSQTLHSCQDTSRNITQGKYAKTSIVHFACEDTQRDSQPPCQNSKLTHMKNKCSQPNLVHKLSYNPTPPKDLILHRGRTEVNRSNTNSQHSQCPSQDITNTYPRGCITIKTVNNLLQNNQVSLHQSNGSFMSLGQGSQYQGMLCQMGRSVDILNVPSSKHVLQRKPIGSNLLLNRSNC